MLPRTEELLLVPIKDEERREADMSLAESAVSRNESVASGSVSAKEFSETLPRGPFERVRLSILAGDKLLSGDAERFAKWLTSAGRRDPEEFELCAVRL